MSSGFSSGIRQTPFHARTAERNGENLWVSRGAFTVPVAYGDVAQEVLAARVSAVLCDISAEQRLRIHGSGAADFVAAAFGADAKDIPAGHSLPVRWTNEHGGIRGSGVLARAGETNFLLLSRDVDAGWFEAAAPRFPASVRDEAAEKAMLSISGPLAFAVLAAADLESALALQMGQHSAMVWRGITISLSRVSALRGWEVSCAPADALEMFDRFDRAGRLFGMTLMGEAAREILLLESGEVVAGLDYAPVRNDAALPSADALGLVAASDLVLTGIALDGDEPAGFAAVLHDGKEIGGTLRSVYSPTLRRAIALAVLPRAFAMKDAKLRVAVPGTVAGLSGIVMPLPFVPAK